MLLPPQCYCPLNVAVPLNVAKVMQATRACKINRKTVVGVGVVVPRPIHSYAPYGLASTAPTPPTVLRTFSWEPWGPTSHMVLRASDLKHVIETNSGKVFAAYL